MKKQYILLILLIGANLCLAQTPEIKNDVPAILPPSPTVAALMKFEEVPVSNYSGIPDISIPLFISPTHSKDINLDIALKYHPASVAPYERASDVGLGWSLFAGGTISRTVRGMPDELARGGTEAMIGIYKDSMGLNLNNNYYEALSALISIDSLGGSGAEREIGDEFLWNARTRGVYDTEHDLWQFNFMGKTGRFYIKKSASNQLEVVPLDDFKVKIINDYVDSGTIYELYKPTGFVIYDEKGYKYVFDIVETTTAFSVAINTSITSEIGMYQGPTYSYNSAFHISKIYDNNGQPIIDFLYKSNKIVERVFDKSQTYYVEDTSQSISINDFINGIPCHDNVKNFNPYPMESNTPTQRDTSVKKLQQIKVMGIAKIDFVYSKGRYDTNFLKKDSSYVFRGITVKDWNDNTIKKVMLDTIYQELQVDGGVVSKRLFLKKVGFSNSAGTDEFAYNLDYKNCLIGLDPDAFLYTDYWGYLNERNSFFPSGMSHRDTNPYFTTHQTLQKMTLPAGGCVVFDFESNTYSHIGDTALAGFDANPNNWDVIEKKAEFIAYSGNSTPTISNTKCFFTINGSEEQNVPFIIAIQYPPSGTTIYSWIINLYKVNGTNLDLIKTLTKDDDTQYLTGFYNHLEPGEYRVNFNPWGYSPGLITFTATVTAYPKIRNGNNYKYLYGGGNRIKRIGYFKEADVPQNAYEVSWLTPSKEKNYNYNFFDNSLKSSGSLAYEVPNYGYAKTKKECTYCQADLPASFITSKDETDFYYNVVTKFNNLQPVKTQGADVGYQNVKVYETDNGYSEFIYTSPIDYPETIGAENLSPPFLPTENYDYKRGLLRFETLYDKFDKILKKTNFEYAFEGHIELTGIKTWYNQYDFINIYNHQLFSDYDNYIRTCSQYGPSSTSACFPYFLTDPFSCDCFCYYGRPLEFISFKFIKEAYGWAKLTAKNTKDYFYPGGSTPAEIVQADETYSYNPLNKQISESTITNSLGETLKTKYDYHTGNSTYSQNRISEIEKITTYRDSELLTTNQIVYSNSFAGNASYLPQTIQTAKESQSMEGRVKYNKYDEYGNPLEVQQQDGTTISYIWGYHKTQPVAKIENCAYSTIPSSMITAIQTASDTNNNEANLLTALNLLRPALDMSMVTTYTYKPLIGISTITDPKGDVVTYTYDPFQRLEAIFDKNGNKRSENEYHYKNQ